MWVLGTCVFQVSMYIVIAIKTQNNQIAPPPVPNAPLWNLSSSNYLFSVLKSPEFIQTELCTMQGFPGFSTMHLRFFKKVLYVLVHFLFVCCYGVLFSFQRQDHYVALVSLKLKKKGTCPASSLVCDTNVCYILFFWDVYYSMHRYYSVMCITPCIVIILGCILPYASLFFWDVYYPMHRYFSGMYIAPCIVIILRYK